MSNYTEKDILVMQEKNRVERHNGLKVLKNHFVGLYPELFPQELVCLPSLDDDFDTIVFYHYMPESKIKYKVLWVGNVDFNKNVSVQILA